MSAKRQPRRPDGAESVLVNIRVDPALRDAVKAKAAERGETVSAAMVRLMRRYVRS